MPIRLGGMSSKQDKDWGAGQRRGCVRMQARWHASLLLRTEADKIDSRYVVKRSGRARCGPGEHLRWEAVVEVNTLPTARQRRAGKGSGSRAGLTSVLWESLA